MHEGSCVVSQANAGELPALMRIEEVAVGGTRVALGCHARGAAQHVLAAHEFAVVLTERTGAGAVSRIRRVGALRPFPNVAEHLHGLGQSGWLRRQRPQGARAQRIAAHGQTLRGCFPFKLRWQTLAGPAREGVGFEVADVAHRGGAIDGNEAAKRHLPPLAVFALPIARCDPAFAVNRGPAVGQPVCRRGVAAICHELQPLGIGDQPVGQSEVAEEHRVAGTFVVVGEALPVVSDAMNATGKIQPSQRGSSLA